MPSTTTRRAAKVRAGYPETGRRRFARRDEERAGTRFAEGALEGGGEPLGGRREARFETGALVHALRALGQPTKHRVRKRRHAIATDAAHERHGFVHRRERGHTIQPEELVSRDEQVRVRLRIEVRFAPRGRSRHLRVDERPVPKRAVHELRRERTIAGLELGRSIELGREGRRSKRPIAKRARDDTARDETRAHEGTRARR